MYVGLDKLGLEAPLEDEPASLLVPEPLRGNKAVVVELVEKLTDVVYLNVRRSANVLNGYVLLVLKDLDDLNALLTPQYVGDSIQSLVAHGHQRFKAPMYTPTRAT
jgi:hypothetical protein